MPVGLFISLFLVLVTGGTVYNHHQVHGAFNTTYVLVVFFLALNLLICFWELCLFARIDHINKKYKEYMQQYADNKSQPAINFMKARVTAATLFSPTFWSETWSSYAMFDGSYADKRTYGFAIDIGNGMSTLIPSVLIHIGYTYHFVEARVLGIIAVLFFYQVTYGTVLYWISFLVNKRHKLISFNENMMYIVGTNAPWFVLGVLGIYTSVRLIIDNSFAVFGM